MANEMTTTDKNEVDLQGGEALRSGPVYRPATDIYQSDDRVVIVTDMPGVAPEDVDVTLERRVLTIRGQVATEPPEGHRPFHGEYGVGDFERVFTLSEDIDRDKITARQAAGVLTLELPKAASAKPKKIAVGAA
ncbi:Hsp20/alpha crystallin family protein [Notoacmeibacter marinus]|uniref:Hsp20/alpha crystallin family protein n=1 Tax=Notoacmeibacter marinus TaxID=1876515 RepID=UPI000DF34FEC|nr:Hsp20/alpha crystallin family protein [Notoacmeibacter marinus]